LKVAFDRLHIGTGQAGRIHEHLGEIGGQGIIVKPPQVKFAQLGPGDSIGG